MPRCTAAGCGCENFQPQKLVDTKCRICLHWAAQHGVGAPAPAPARAASPASRYATAPASRPVASPMTCACGTQNEPSSVFCVECGSRLGAPAKPPTVLSGDLSAAEAMRVAAHKAALDKAAVDKVAAEREATKKAGAEKLALAKAEKLASEKLALEKAEKERVAAEKFASEKAMAERIANEKAAIEKVQAEKEKAERLEQERVASEKLALERAERLERERVEKAEKDRIAAEKQALERAELAEKERLEKLEKDKLAAEKMELEKLEKAKIAEQKAEEENAKLALEKERAAATAAAGQNSQPSPKTAAMRGMPPRTMSTASSPSSSVADDMPIAEAIKLQLPGRAEKWPLWTKTFEAEDIDTVGDLRRLTQSVWQGMNLSALVRSALEELRAPGPSHTAPPPIEPAPAANTSLKAVEPVRSPSPALAAASASHACSTCGVTLLKGAVFCGKCGTKTNTTPMCECGVTFLPGAAFCGKCGNKAPSGGGFPPPPNSGAGSPRAEVEQRNHARTLPFSPIRSVTLDEGSNSIHSTSTATAAAATTLSSSTASSAPTPTNASKPSSLPSNSNQNTNTGHIRSQSRTRQDYQTAQFSKTQSFSPRALQLDNNDHNNNNVSKTQTFSPRLLQSNSPSARIPALPRTLPQGVGAEDEAVMASEDSDDDNTIVETGRERRETIASLTSTLSKPFTVTKGTAYGVRQTRVIAIDEQAMTIKFCAQNLTLRSEVPISQFTLAQVNEKRLALSFTKRSRIYDLTFADAQECSLFISNYQAARKTNPQSSMIERSSSSVLSVGNSSGSSTPHHQKNSSNVVENKNMPVNHQEYCVVKKNQYNQRQSRIVVLKPKALVLLDAQHKFKKSFPYHHLHSIEVQDTNEESKKGGSTSSGSSNSGNNEHMKGEAEAFLLFQKATGQRPFQLFFADAFERSHFSQSVKTLYPLLVLKENSENNELRFVVTKLEVNAVSSCREGKRRMLEVRVKDGVIRSYDRFKQFKDTHFHAIRSLAPCPLDKSRLYITKRKRFALDFPDHTSRDRFLAFTMPLLDQVKGISSRKISIFCGTWNMGSSVPTQDTNLNQFLPPDSFDIYALGMQECPHSAREAWVTQFRNQIGETKYVLVGSAKLWEISLAVFVRRELAYKVSCREADTVASGVGDVLGNKGAAAVCMRFEDSTMCFICTHLAAQSDKVKERRDDFLKILRCLRFGNKELDVIHYADHVLWMGDLNYRVEMFFYDTVASCEKKDYPELLSHDQLRREMNFPDGYKCVFPNFQEGEITFAPTYRWEKSRNVFSNKKDQSPSYTDRVLWHTSQQDHISLVDYGSAPDVLGSDHRPVFATFTIQPRSFAWAREAGQVTITLVDVVVTGPQLDETVPLELLFSAPFLSDDILSDPSAPLQVATSSGRFRREGGFHWANINFACSLARSALSQFHLLVTVRVVSASTENTGLGHGAISLTYQEDKFNCLLTRDGLVLGTLTGAIAID